MWARFTLLNETPIGSAIAGCVLPLSRSNTIWMRSRCAAGIFHRSAVFSSRICFLVHLTIRPPESDSQSESYPAPSRDPEKRQKSLDSNSYGSGMIKDHHAAYITWDEFERNLKAIANNATGMSSALTRGAAREGELLLPGLLRCGLCGRKLHVHCGGKLGRYNCYGARMNHGTERCISVSGLSIDAAIAKEVLRVLKSLGIEAAVKAIEAQSSKTTAAQRQLELSLQQARYEVAHARRQYDAVDPANRLVAG